MRNVWHHKGLAEYMTKKRFGELGLTESAIGVRDRTYGTQTLVEDDAKAAKATAALKLAEEGPWVSKKESVTMAVCLLSFSPYSPLSLVCGKCMRSVESLTRVKFDK